MRKNLKGLFLTPDIPYNKDTSLYYELLVKNYGKEYADRCWQNRIALEQKYDFSVEKDTSFCNIWLQVKDYKPKDPLCLIGDLNWGYNSIKDLN
jgi:hypothetical protein